MNTPPPNIPEQPTGARRITAAAVRHNGVTYTGAHHHLILWQIACCTGEKAAGPQGFVASNGVFYERKEAREIAVAANQIRFPLDHPTDELFSEELWSWADWCASHGLPQEAKRVPDQPTAPTERPSSVVRCYGGCGLDETPYPKLTLCEAVERAIDLGIRIGGSQKAIVDRVMSAIASVQREEGGEALLREAKITLSLAGKELTELMGTAVTIDNTSAGQRQCIASVMGSCHSVSEAIRAHLSALHSAPRDDKKEGA